MIFEKSKSINDESIFMSHKILFCSDSLCDIIKNTLIILFKNCNSNNTILFNSLDMSSLRTTFYTNLSKSTSCKYYISNLNKDTKLIIDKYLEIINPKKNIIALNQKIKQKKSDIKIMMKLLNQVQNLTYAKDIITLCHIKLIYTIKNFPIQYIIKAKMNTNIKDSHMIFSIDITSICEKYTVTNAT